jgi:bifunctional non-homologous end joining protein LigD
MHPADGAEYVSLRLIGYFMQDISLGSIGLSERQLPISHGANVVLRVHDSHKPIRTAWFPRCGSLASDSYFRESALSLLLPQFAFQPCIPTRGTKVPSNPDWIHELKYDGYRLIVQRDGDRVKLITRNGYDWTERYPRIVESALKNRQKHFVIDGEAVILGVDGVSDFNALHSGRRNEKVQLYAFDMLAGDGDDMRSLPLSVRKANLARLLARRPDGIFVAPFEQGEIGPDLFRQACNFGLEGLVSKRKDRPYRGGRSPHWIKVKNPVSPAMNRAKDAF